jgi:hypothetical protein
MKYMYTILLCNLIPSGEGMESCALYQREIAQYLQHQYPQTSPAAAIQPPSSSFSTFH